MTYRRSSPLGWLGPCLAGLFLFLPVSPLSGAQPESSVRLELHQSAGRHFFRLAGLSAEASARLVGQTGLDSILIVHMVGVGESMPPLLGRVVLDEGALTFHPRYPLQPGTSYRVVFDPGSPELPRLEQEFAIPAAAERTPAEITAVYPSSDRVPENLLKFYLHFSRSMSRGQVYRYIHLFQGDREVELPFLEIEQELWDADFQRLTLLIDPGRIKRGLLPYQEAGTALEAGRSYRLVIDSRWPDAEGEPLRAGFEKSFQVMEPERNPVEPSSWIVKAPEAGGRDPLRVEFGRSMDQALVLRLLHVQDESGAPIAGRSSLAEQETVWLFQPIYPWAAADYALSFSEILEDLAGNRIGRPFEVDVFEPVQKRITETVHRIPFRIQ